MRVAIRSLCHSGAKLRPEHRPDSQTDTNDADKCVTSGITGVLEAGAMKFGATGKYPANVDRWLFGFHGRSFSGGLIDPPERAGASGRSDLSNGMNL